MNRPEPNIARADRLLAMLGGIVRAAVRADSPDRLCREVCRISVECGLFTGAWIGFVAPSRGKVRMLAGNGPDGSIVPSPPEYELARLVHAQGEICVYRDLSALPAELHDALARRGVVSVAGLPLREAEKIAGVFMLYAGEDDCFDAPTLSLLHDLSKDISFSLDHMIGEQRRLATESKLHYMAFYDAQTGLPNRAHLDERLPSFAEGGLALLDIRLQRLDRALHLFGRLAMDDILQTLSGRLEDKRGNGFLAQLGMDEFALALPKLTDPAAVEAAARELVAVIEAPVRVGEREVFLSARVGAAIFPMHGEDVSHLLQCARAAADPIGNGGSFRMYSRNLDRVLEQRARTEAELHRALERGEFRLRYQPQLSLRTGWMVGVEALLQWQHPRRGLVGPGEFVPLLEECGLMPAVGAWALREACRQAKAWQAMGLLPLRMGVNLSALQFRLAEIVDVVRDALVEAGLEPAYLELELTESLILENVEQTIHAMHELKNLGVSLSLDDFGTGYSSLSYLRRYPVDRIKIDQSFIRDMVVHAGSAALVRSILAMAHNLGLQTIAEGVETIEQFEYLRKQLCDEMQGFLFSRAVPAEEIACMLADGRSLLSDEAIAAGPGVLLIDPDANILDMLCQVLTPGGWRVLTAQSAGEAFALLAANNIGVVASGLDCADGTEQAFLQRVRDMYPETERVLLAGDVDARAVIDAVNAGEVYRVLAKPVVPAQFQTCIRDAYRRHEMRFGRSDKPDLARG